MERQGVRCPNCGKEFQNAKNRNGLLKKYCSDRCRIRFNQRRGKNFTIELFGLLKKYGFMED